MTATALWREAFDVFERLLELGADAREPELERLKHSRPDLHSQVLKLLQAEQRPDLSLFGDRRTVAAGVGHTGQIGQSAGDTIGPYKLERTLGEGGMGEVWFARRADGLFEAPVALKLLHAHLAASSIRSRFVREGKILGQLTHPHIAHLLDAGVTPAGQLYLAIEYVEGIALDRWCDEQNLGVDERVKLFLQVCEAVAHAHAHLIVHRDLKPSNILVTPEGNIKLLDFGIAKLTESTDQEIAQTELTRIGGRVLTPEYAAPEQITGQPVSVTTDVYSLGVLLYLLLAGRRPYGHPGQSLSQLEREVLETEPEPPSSTQRKLSRDLDVIVMKALKKKPEDRYASVPALAEDLRRYLDHEPVLARPDSLAYRARKYVRRHRLAVTIVSMLAIGLVVSTRLYLDARAARIVAEAATARAEAETARAEKETVQAKALNDFMQFDALAGIADVQHDDRSLGAVKTLLDTIAAKISERLADQPVAAIKLRDALANVYMSLGLAADFTRLAEEEIAQTKRALDGHSPDAAEIGVEAVAGARLFHENEERYQQQLDALAQAQWPTNDLRRLWVHKATALILQRRGDYAGAKRAFDEVETGLKTADAHDNNYKYLRVAVLGDLSIYYLTLGDVRAAESKSRALINFAREVEGLDSGAILAHTHLALSMMGTGRMSEAEQELDVVLSERRQSKSVDTYTTGQLASAIAYAKLNLGLLRTLQGRYAEAQAIADPVFARIDAKTWTSPALGYMPLEEGDLLTMATQYELQGRLNLAAAALRQLLAHLEPHAPADSLDVARDRLMLVNVLREQRQVDEAREQFNLIPASAIAKLESASPDRIELRRAQGLLALAEGHSDEAVAKLDEAAQLSEKTYTDKSFWTIRLRKELADATASRTTP